jgi:hypothetical protein
MEFSNAFNSLSAVPTQPLYTNGIYGYLVKGAIKRGGGLLTVIVGCHYAIQKVPLLFY